ncbi:endoglycoceramidase [Lingula anatina]|uniref:Endoglycoceramidase n=1 Tax=Lingula anatina TaxID=7574 RepID=A0A1S3K9X1_LINAN|nr:endoglycoceramidase [Lingula anatina]|eukprot:XP_013419244.1 endoglycoceramidase [Lingula anatina]
MESLKILYMAVAVFLLTTQAPSISAAGLQKISVNADGWFVDPNGRVMLFHGINMVQKGFPWYPATLLNKTKLRDYKNWGFNAVRLGMMWSGLEPQEGVFNTTYANIMSSIVDTLENYGMYSLLDMHQDVMSSKFQSYDGIPLWLVNKLPNPSQDEAFPWPFKNIGSWEDGYLAKATGMAFQGLYSNRSNALGYFSRFWQTTAKIFKGRGGVLGYELINEPWAGDIWSNLSLLLPGNAGSRNLMPMYNVINKAIRAVDDDTIIFYEPVTWGVIYKNDYHHFGTGFNMVPGGNDYKNRSALSYHYYCWFDKPADEPFPYPEWKRIACDDFWGPFVFLAVRGDREKIGGGSFLTEFGICSTDGNNKTEGTVECESTMQGADAALQSWTYWDSSFYYSNGSVNWNQVRSFSRVYPRATAGTPKYLNFNLTSLIFTYRYVHLVAIQQPTEIFVPKFHYPKGFTVELKGQLKWTFDINECVIYVTPVDSKLKYINAQVIIKPKT